MVFGNSITIPCTINANPTATSMRWEKTSGSNTDIINTTASLKYSGGVLGNTALTINNTDYNDQASYRCIATNPVGDGFSISTSLIVEGSKSALSIAPPVLHVVSASLPLPFAYRGVSNALDKVNRSVVCLCMLFCICLPALEKAYSTIYYYIFWLCTVYHRIWYNHNRILILPV